MDLLFATGNATKAKRFTKGLEKYNINILTLKDINIDIDVEENGKTAIDNAILKAKAYSNVVDIPVMAMDDTLYLDGVSDEYQPGLFVRRVNGKRLNDEEMIEHYINLVKKFGNDGRLTARWVYGIAIINENEVYTYSWSKEDFYLVDTRSDKVNPGYPLNTISVNKKLNKYFTDMTLEDKELVKEDEADVVKFIVKSLKK